MTTFHGLRFDLHFERLFSKANLIEKPVNLLAQVQPQMMRKTNLAMLAVAGTAATCGVHGLIDSINNFSNINFFTRAAQPITTARPTNTKHQLTATQLGK